MSIRAISGNEKFANTREEEIFLLYRQHPQMSWYSTDSSIGRKGLSNVGSILLLEEAA